ncbi:MAG: hypothetical protein GTO24_22300 [candidate division Zixibacteria bacterium]|nr:hypothetical protein [candidate division Zixibacteria bacterium]
MKAPDLSPATKDLALVCCFAPLYTLFSFWPLAPIIGVVGKSITMAAVMAPLVGVLLGPYLGAATASLGGVVGASLAQGGALNPISFLPGTAAAFSAGLLYTRKDKVCILLYVLFLLTLVLYPPIGPFWLYPSFAWFQLAGLLILVSPLTSKAIEFTKNQRGSTRLILGISVICFIATMFAHVVGCLVFEVTGWPLVFPQLDFWQSTWRFLSFVYPVERIVITVLATLIGVPLIKTFQAIRFKPK